MDTTTARPVPPALTVHQHRRRVTTWLAQVQPGDEVVVTTTGGTVTGTVAQADQEHIALHGPDEDLTRDEEDEEGEEEDGWWQWSAGASQILAAGHASRPITVWQTHLLSPHPQDLLTHLRVRDLAVPIERTVTREQLHAEARGLFGRDMASWAVRCPACGHRSSIGHLLDQEQEGAFGRRCGRCPATAEVLGTTRVIAPRGTFRFFPWADPEGDRLEGLTKP